MISSLMIIKEAHSMQANITFLTFFYSVFFAFCTSALTPCIDRVMLAQWHRQWGGALPRVTPFEVTPFGVTPYYDVKS